MTYEENVQALGERTATALEGLWGTYLEGALTYEEFSAAASLLVSAARAKGVAVAELTLGAYLEQALGYVPAPAGLPAADIGARFTKALATITASELDTVMQLRRLASSEVRKAAADGFSEVIRSSAHVGGYTRGLESGACELCRWLYRDGYVFPADQPMQTHDGCLCHPVPVTNN